MSSRRFLLQAAILALMVSLAIPGLAQQGPAFIENRGQWDRQAKFLLRSPGLDLWITDHGVVYDLYHVDQASGRHDVIPAIESRMLDTSVVVDRAAVFVTFIGAQATASAHGSERTEGYHNYYIGNDSSRWATNVPLYSRARIERLYEGVDALFYLDGGKPRYDLTVASGADVSQVRMKIEGATGVHVSPTGALAIETSFGTLEQRGLYAYQQSEGGKRQQVDCRFVVEENSRVRFETGTYDHARPLVIDPIVYSTYLGGGDIDVGNGIAVTGGGDVYMTGYSQSVNFPTTSVLQPSNAGRYDAFVTKLTPSGRISYSTYFGGDSSEDGRGIVSDGSGSSYITGYTNSPDFPTHNAIQSSLAGTYSDAFVVRLMPDGTLSYSTYLGGWHQDVGTSVAVDQSGNAYVTGNTMSDNFPTRNAFHPSNVRSRLDGFVTKLTVAGALAYSTYIGGANDDGGNSIVADSSGNIYVTGFTNSTDFPTLHAMQSSMSGTDDAFVTKLTPNGSLDYSTYLGGGHDTEGLGIALDDSDQVYITGFTNSTDFPTLHPMQASITGGQDVFVTELNSDGAIIYSTYLGGSIFDEGTGIAVDKDHNIYVTGRTQSTDFPVLGAMQPSFAGGLDDAFLTRLSATGMLSYSTYLGGTSIDVGTGVGVDGIESAYIVGLTNSADFPVLRAIQPSFAGYTDAFITRLSFTPNASALSNQVILDQLSVAPNPASEELRVSFTVQQPGAVAVELFCNDGRRVEAPFQREYTSGEHVESISTAGLAAGWYTLRLTGEGHSQVSRFVVVR